MLLLKLKFVISFIAFSKKQG